MIHFDHADSPFYESNKQYCLEFAEKLRTKHVECKGFCTAYGFDVEAYFSCNGLEYRTNVHKFQTSRGEEGLPDDAVDDGSTEIMISGLAKRHKITGGRSAFFRLLSSSALKNHLPHPYYISFNIPPTEEASEKIIAFFNSYRIMRMRVGNGEFHCRLHTHRADPLQLLSFIDELVSHWLY